MDMSSVEFQHLMATFTMDLGKTRADLHEALNEDLPEEEERAVLEAGQRKVAQFEALLGRLDETRRQMAIADCREEMDKITERVRLLKEKRS